MKVIVTDAYERKSLAATRHLGRRGCFVAAAGVKPWEQAFFSKYCRKRILYPNPVREPERFADSLLAVLEAEKFDCVLPMSCYTSVILSRRRDEFAKYTNLALPDGALLDRVRDKVEMARLARSLGIGAPETFTPRSVDEARELAAHIRYPCVVKYRHGTGSLGIRYARTPEELVTFFGQPAHDEDVVFDRPVPIVQEYAEGVITDVCCLFNHGQPRAAEVHQRTRTWPPSGGWGTTYLTIDAPDLKAKALRLLSAVGWHGPALVEFKVDPATGAEKLMEVNTRFWGGLDVSYHAGVDFAWMAVRMAVEGDVEPAWDYKVGRRYRCIFSSQLKSTLAGDNRLDGILDYMSVRPNTGYDLWPSDPLPHLVNAGLALYRPVRSVFGWLRSNRSSPRAG